MTLNTAFAGKEIESMNNSGIARVIMGLAWFSYEYNNPMLVSGNNGFSVDGKSNCKTKGILRKRPPLPQFQASWRQKA